MRRLALALAAALLACASPARAREAPARSGPYSMDLVDESGRSLPTFEHRGRTWVLGRLGERYLLRVRNGTGRRVEVVASVDGRDVVDGRPASTEKRGYLVEPWGELTIDGFRLSRDAVAAFRFSSVPDSYAARMGDARDVGVVGVAVFPERERRIAPPPRIGLGREPGGRGADLEERGAPAPAEGEASASGPSPKATARAEERPGLGTAFGEEHGSHVDYAAFERQSRRPAAMLTVRYDDHRGLAAQGIDVTGDGWARRDDSWRRRTARPFPGAFAEPPPGWR
ncbi:MAG TPA: hypothetical protein VH880_10365 [Anaeromyxobacteraceae bacterium]|jgi:hypothetical protein